MFGKKVRVKGDGIPGDILGFLDEADKLYIKAFETRSIRVLKDYFSKDLCMRLASTIVAEGASRYFGNEKFRLTEWKPIQVSESEGIYEKSVVYDSVKVAGSFNLKVSTDYVEQWKISITPDELMVSDVKTL